LISQFNSFNFHLVCIGYKYGEVAYIAELSIQYISLMTSTAGVV
jgi:hypothetical protein